MVEKSGRTATSRAENSGGFALGFSKRVDADFVARDCATLVPDPFNARAHLLAAEGAVRCALDDGSTIQGDPLLLPLVDRLRRNGHAVRKQRGRQGSGCFEVRHQEVVAHVAD